ncbi:hypothetical protein [Kribbella sp. NPDC003557]|uniref:hypothetical protein n=1 Tax=Kribbella sp. NPDC003557 TaxID=3154449 RepID=UPI00339F59B2
MSALLFPIGHAAGPHVAGDPVRHVVRVGRTTELLSEAELRVWDLAHRSADVTDLLAACEAAHIDDADQHVEVLLRRGVLARADDTIAFAQQHRLRPLFVGLGNRPDDPGRFAIGVPGLEPLATVDPTTYELWQWGWVAPSLWAHCEVLATIGEQVAGEPGVPADQLGTVLDGLSTLLSESVVVLDTVS